MATSKALVRFRYACSTYAGNKPLCRGFTTPWPLRQASSSLPRVAQPSFWSSLIPKPFRRSTDPIEHGRKAAARDTRWNPATAFIILGIVVGSNAINLIALRNDMLNFSRKTDAKLALLREVIQKVKDGEDVDVKRVLGTDDQKEEAEWEQAVKELETTDMLWEGRKKREAKRLEKSGQATTRDEDQARMREGSSKEDDKSSEAGTRPRPKFLM